MNVLADRASDTQRRAPTYQVLVDDIKALDAWNRCSA
jgi:hypothetical protein